MRRTSATGHMSPCWGLQITWPSLQGSRTTTCGELFWPRVQIVDQACNLLLLLWLILSTYQNRSRVLLLPSDSSSSILRSFMTRTYNLYALNF